MHALRRYFWVVHLLTITLCAGFLANAAGNWALGCLPPPPQKRAIAAPRTRISTTSAPPTRDVTALVSRNIFCSTCEPEELVERPDSAEAETSDVPANNAPVETSLKVRLLATMVGEPDPSVSFAAIAQTEEGKDGEEPQEVTRLYARGDSITGDAVITDILPRQVFLLNGGRREYIDLAGDGEANAGRSSSKPRTATVKSKHSPKSDLMKEFADGVRRVGGNKWEIQRSALNKVLANTSMLARSARIVPSVKNGKPDGFKLYGMRPGSFYSMLGMFNGDTINAINGHPITTPDKALEIYTKLRSASHVSLSFTRQGKQVTHEYNIR